MPFPLKYLLALVYRLGYLLHHHFCLQPGEPLSHAKLIVVGSFLAGGAGKTPFCLWLVRQIPKKFRVAVLCHSKAWDEVNLYEIKLADCENVRIIATKNRYKTAHEIDEQFDFIICDDGFEDSRLVGAKIVRLDWSQPPSSLKDLIPLGKHRSLCQDHCEPDLQVSCHGETPDISFMLDDIPAADKQLRGAVVCGLGNPERFVQDLEEVGVNVQKVVRRPDHDGRFTIAVERALKGWDVVWMTEKDACRLTIDLQRNSKIRIVSQAASTGSCFIKKVNNLLKL